MPGRRCPLGGGDGGLGLGACRLDLLPGAGLGRLGALRRGRGGGFRLGPGPGDGVVPLSAGGLDPGAGVGAGPVEFFGRYRGRPPALAGTPAEEARTAYLERGASIAALARAHGVNRAAVRTALAGLLPGSPAPARPED